MDRRIPKTQKAILDAFVGLMAEKNFEQITINEIADRANVNRGTIYLHYTDKFDLLDQCIDMHVMRLFDACLDSDASRMPSKAAMLRVFEYLEQHAAIYMTLMNNKGVTSFRSRLMDAILQGIDEQMDGHIPSLEINKAITVQFLASAAVGVVEWWMTNSMPCPALDVVEQLWCLLERIQVVPQTEIQPG